MPTRNRNRRRNKNNNNNSNNTNATSANTSQISTILSNCSINSIAPPNTSNSLQDKLREHRTKLRSIEHGKIVQFFKTVTYPTTLEDVLDTQIIKKTTNDNKITLNLGFTFKCWRYGLSNTKFDILDNPSIFIQTLARALGPYVYKIAAYNSGFLECIDTRMQQWSTPKATRSWTKTHNIPKMKWTSCSAQTPQFNPPPTFIITKNCIILQRRWYQISPNYDYLNR
eukprot:915178_1